MNWTTLADNLSRQWELLPDRLAGHITLSLAAIAAGVAVSVPLGAVVSRFPRAEQVVLTVASVLQTVPSLALLALMVFFFGTIGWGPAFAALFLYSLLPVLRNTATGLESVDPAVLEAAQGVGMTPRQSLLRVQLPLAAPTIVAGIRTASVWVVGAATIAQPVGATSLGNYIFVGLQTMNFTALVFGCIAAAVLALVLDAILAAAHHAAATRDATWATAAAGALAVVIASPYLLRVVQTGGVSASDQAATGDFAGEAPFVVGGKSFTEQYILAELIGERLKAAGAEVKVNAGMGSATVFTALASGQVDFYVDYTGTLWANVLKRKTPAKPIEMLLQTAVGLERDHGVVCLGPLGFANDYVFALRPDRAAELGAASLSDLANVSENLTLGGDIEFFDRPEWRSVVEAYDLEFAGTRSMDSALMYNAVQQGSVDAIVAFRTDGRIAAFGLTVLDDPLGALPPYDAVLLASARAAENPAALAAVRPLLESIDSQTMRQANAKVDLEGRTPSDAASELNAAIDAAR